MTMNITVVGLWHLGTVTAACMAALEQNVIGLDLDENVINNLNSGKAPIMEPGLDKLLQQGILSGRLRFVNDPILAIKNAEIVWVTYDTPVDENDKADVEYVLNQVVRLFPHIKDGTIVLISSQVPVGTTKHLENMFRSMHPMKKISFGYSPENLRLGSAVSVFMRPERIVIGVRSQSDRKQVEVLLKKITDNIEWMSVESAEMTKHALNAFLAASIAFANEMAAVCEKVGADAKEVERGLKTESRIGTKAYLAPGCAFAGGTLARDIGFLTKIGQEYRVPLHLIPAVRSSNDEHKNWLRRKLIEVLGDLKEKRIGVWGLTYKPGTNTLRRSISVEQCVWMAMQGAKINAHDPAINVLPSELKGIITLNTTPLDAVKSASVLVIATEWPEYKNVLAKELLSVMNDPTIIDANRFLFKEIGENPCFRYLSVGMPIYKA